MMLSEARLDSSRLFGGQKPSECRNNFAPKRGCKAYRETLWTRVPLKSPSASQCRPWAIPHFVHVSQQSGP